MDNNLMNDIREGMDVYDSTDHNMGSVLFIHMGGTANNIDDDDLPSNSNDDVRKRLIEEGYIRIGNAIFSTGSYATAKEIDRIEGANVYLKIKQKDILRD